MIQFIFSYVWHANVYVYVHVFLGVLRAQKKRNFLYMKQIAWESRYRMITWRSSYGDSHLTKNPRIGDLMMLQVPVTVMVNTRSSNKTVMTMKISSMMMRVSLNTIKWSNPCSSLHELILGFPKWLIYLG